MIREIKQLQKVEFSDNLKELSGILANLTENAAKIVEELNHGKQPTATENTAVETIQVEDALEDSSKSNHSDNEKVSSVHCASRQLIGLYSTLASTGLSCTLG